MIAAVTIPDTTNSAPGTPLAAVLYGEEIFLYYMNNSNDAKKLMRTSRNVGNTTSTWSTPAERTKLKAMNSDTQLCATVSEKENMVFYVEKGAKVYNIHRDPRK